jgi:3-hydroxybenzoate 6-monooxygenase
MAKVLIAGGGISGLASAIGISNLGHEVIVLERAQTFKELGAGIQLGPNAFHALDYLGVDTAICEKGIFIDELRFMDGISGNIIAKVPLGRHFQDRFSNPYAVIHRPDLHGVLLETCKRRVSVKLHTNCHVSHYSQNDTSVAVELATGEKIVGKALIGADGLRSAIRKQIARDGCPKNSGHVTYRAVLPLNRVPEELQWNAATLWAGPKSHVVHYPLAGGKLMNIAATRDIGESEFASGKSIDKEEVCALFSHMNELPRRLINCGNQWRYWTLCDRDPIEKWTDRRVVLIGDAAHPMLQYLAQGACIALEDAATLSMTLQNNKSDFQSAFEEFNKDRASRSAQVQMSARLIGEHIYHPTGVQAQVRTAIMSSLSTKEFYDKLAWLYDNKHLAEANDEVTTDFGTINNKSVAK